MQLHEAEQLARHLMREFECDGWAFRWTNARRQCGHAGQKVNRRTGEITDLHLGLSRHLVALNGFDEVNNTIRHEIAHIKAGLDNGHNHVWRRWCAITGANPQRCANAETVNMPEPPFAVVCTLCNRVLARRHRRSRNLTRGTCKFCGPASMNKLAWRHAC